VQPIDEVFRADLQVFEFPLVVDRPLSFRDETVLSGRCSISIPEALIGGPEDIHTISTQRVDVCAAVSPIRCGRFEVISRLQSVCI
jgi:hypothetical protein